jgi:hypothetical protein
MLHEKITRQVAKKKCEKKIAPFQASAFFTTVIWNWKGHLLCNQPTLFN